MLQAKPAVAQLDHIVLKVQDIPTTVFIYEDTLGNRAERPNLNRSRCPQRSHGADPVTLYQGSKRQPDRDCNAGGLLRLRQACAAPP